MGIFNNEFHPEVVPEPTALILLALGPVTGLIIRKAGRSICKQTQP